MDWISQLNDAMSYVEENLTKEITLTGAARRAACSAYHFQRMFPYMTGISFSEYVRRRRMTAAAMDLAEGARVIDTAARYGYDSPTAFNRAFQSVHGLPPSAAQVRGAALRSFPRITFTLSIKGEEAMEYRIEERDAFRVAGFAMRGPMSLEACFEQVPAFWEQTAGEIPRLAAMIDGSGPMGILGVSACDGGRFSGYYIAAATGSPVPEGMEEYTVPAGTWAVFPCCGPMPQAMQDLQRRIVGEWLPSSGYEYAEAPDIEIYSADNHHNEVWLPIVRKK